MKVVEELYRAVQARPRPEDVAELVIQAIGYKFTPEEAKVANAAANYSFKRRGHKWSAMLDDFRRPDDASKHVLRAGGMMNMRATAETINASNPAEVVVMYNLLAESIGFVPGDKKRNKARRHAAGIFKNQRWYNKRFRACVHLYDKLNRLTQETLKYNFTRISKSNFATKISFQDFAADLQTACLVAYMAARQSRRSIFTNLKQDRPFDKFAHMLLERCKQSETTRWDVLAYSMPDAFILSQLTEEQKVQLLSLAWNTMVDAGSVLKRCFDVAPFDMGKMIVKRGTDSSTWNQTAGAWNQARTHWISLVHALDADALLDQLCPGKVMRLMAADVAYWHRATDGDLHDDTGVFGALPKPWDVVNGDAICNRQTITLECKRFNVSPNSWIGAKANRQAVEYKPTPELVHGVEVASPALAKALRKAGVFSGKAVNVKQLVTAIGGEDDQNTGLGRG